MVVVVVVVVVVNPVCCGRSGVGHAFRNKRSDVMCGLSLSWCCECGASLSWSCAFGVCRC